MKAVVLDIKKNKAVALSDDGMVKEVTNKNFRIGQMIEMERKSMKKMSKKYRNIAAGVAASLVILLGGGTAYAYNTPVAHVSLDVNPSVTYSVNAFNRVIDVDKNNSDAKSIYEMDEWNGENISEVIKNTILTLQDNGYLVEDNWYEDGIIIGVNATSKDKENQLILAIKVELAKIVAEEEDTNTDTDTDIDKDTDTDTDTDTTKFDDVVIGIGAERVALTAELNKGLDFVVTPGKVNLVQKLYASEFDNQESTSSEALEWITSTEGAFWLEGSVKDIMAQIKANRLELKGKTVEESDTDLTDDDSDTNGIENTNGNNGNGEGKVKANDNAGEDENEMELERNENANANANQKGLSRGAIELEDK